MTKGVDIVAEQRNQLVQDVPFSSTFLISD